MPDERGLSAVMVVGCAFCPWRIRAMPDLLVSQVLALYDAHLATHVTQMTAIP